MRSFDVGNPFLWGFLSRASFKQKNCGPSNLSLLSRHLQRARSPDVAICSHDFNVIDAQDVGASSYKHSSPSGALSQRHHFRFHCQHHLGARLHLQRHTASFPIMYSASLLYGRIKDHHKLYTSFVLFLFVSRLPRSVTWP